MGATFELDGQRISGTQWRPALYFHPAISMFVNCETQDEIDELWEKLSAGGRESRCGWLKDKFRFVHGKSFLRSWAIFAR